MQTIFHSTSQRTLRSMSEEKDGVMFMAIILRSRLWRRCTADLSTSTATVQVGPHFIQYCIKIIHKNISEPINIFQHIPQSESEVSIPMRLCYHRGVHYNSLVDPNNASLGVGLGLPGLKPGINDKNTVR